MLIFWILCIILCAVLGSSKGYSVWVCIVAGALGSLLAVLVLFLLPDQNQEAADLSRRDQEIAALRQRVAELERAQQPAKDDGPHCDRFAYFVRPAERGARLRLCH